MVGFGTVLQRYHSLSLETLARVSMYLLVPSFLLIKIYDSDIPWGEIGLIALVFLLVLGALGVLLFASGRALRAPNKTVAAAILGSIVFNAGNFGIPVAHLLYIEGGTLFQGQPDTEAGLHVQALVVMLSNLLVWFLGYVVLAVARGGRAREALGILKLPIPYALVGSFVLREIRLRSFNGADFLPVWASFPLRSLAGALVPMMLVALGRTARQGRPLAPLARGGTHRLRQAPGPARAHRRHGLRLRPVALARRPPRHRRRRPHRRQHPHPHHRARRRRRANRRRRFLDHDFLRRHSCRRHRRGDRAGGGLMAPRPG